MRAVSASSSASAASPASSVSGFAGVRRLVLALVVLAGLVALPLAGLVTSGAQAAGAHGKHGHHAKHQAKHGHHAKNHHGAKRDGAKRDAKKPTEKPARSQGATPDSSVALPAPGEAGGAGQICASGTPATGALFGSSDSGSVQLADREAFYGRTLGVHRMFFQANQVDKAITAVKADLAAGRQPWISFKAPYSWAEMATGRGDEWARTLTTKLATVEGPVWLAIHHEPEGDGPMEQWTAMQRRIAAIVHAGAANVEYSVILISWNMFYGPAADQRLEKVWPGDATVDLIGMDMYNDYGAVRGGQAGKLLDTSKYYGPLSRFAAAHGDKPWGIAEIGITPALQADHPGWLAQAFTDLAANGGVAMSYFDSTGNLANDITNWSLTDLARRRAVRTVLTTSTHTC